MTACEAMPRLVGLRRIVWGFAVGMTLALCLSITKADGALAAGWTVQPVPAPPNGQLSGVSCTSTSACAAVGSYADSTGNIVTLAEQWNGTSWQVQSTPNPAGATTSILNGVSCTSATSCTAVGYYEDSSFNQLPLAEQWNGTSWQIQSTPNPAGSQGSILNRVSCTSATACIAVGKYSVNSTNGPGSVPVALAEQWNGTSWQIQSIPTPTGAAFGESLEGVSCASASSCSAVGGYFDAARTEQTLTEQWNGTSWQVQSSPNPTGALGSGLGGVSCTSVNACTAVGNYTNSAGSQVTLAEQWNGTSWQIQSTPNPTGATTNLLTGVSCASATSCSAVGNDFDSTHTQVTLAEQWNGTSWQIQSTPNPGASYSVLSDVSCPSTGLCTAVGYDNNGTNTVPLAEQYAPSALVPTGLTSPTITGRTVVGQTLTEHHGTWTGSPTRYTYEWKDCNAAVTVCTTIATTRNYTLRDRDVGSRLLVLETAYNSAGASIAESSVPTATVTRPAAARPPALQQAPKVTGLLTLNHRLKASRGAWAGHPSSYSYRWFACQRIGELCTPIPGANHRTYRAGRSVLNEQIEVWVTAYNRAGASAPARSSTRRTVTQR